MRGNVSIVRWLLKELNCDPDFKFESLNAVRATEHVPESPVCLLHVATSVRLYDLLLRMLGMQNHDGSPELLSPRSLAFEKGDINVLDCMFRYGYDPDDRVEEEDDYHPFVYYLPVRIVTMIEG